MPSDLTLPQASLGVIMQLSSKQHTCSGVPAESGHAVFSSLFTLEAVFFPVFSSWFFVSSSNTFKHTKHKATASLWVYSGCNWNMHKLVLPPTPAVPLMFIRGSSKCPPPIENELITSAVKLIKSRIQTVCSLTSCWTRRCSSGIRYDLCSG